MNRKEEIQALSDRYKKVLKELQKLTASFERVKEDLKKIYEKKKDK